MAQALVPKCKVSVGCPPPPSSLGLRGEEWTSFQFHFHNFATLHTSMAHYTKSPAFTCNGRQWQLIVYPGDEDANEGMVSVYLQHLSEGNITIPFQIDVIDKFGNSKRAGSGTQEFSTTKELSSTADTFGWENWIPRSDILDESKNILDSYGTLTLVISIDQEPTTVFVPRNSFLNMLTEMFKFNDETTADVCFEVVSCTDKKKGEDDKKKVKASVLFHAHRSILKKCAPMLADLMGSSNTATITDVKPEIFHHLLYYVYGGKVPEKDLETHAKDIIDAADKYSIVDLKLAAEAAYVEATDITVDNAIDNLLYADRKNCALLKEKVMNFLADNHYEAAEKISFTDFPVYVVKDLLIAFGRNSREGTGTNVDKLTTLCVSALRRKLHRLGLEVDGSRETMIEAIKAHSSSPPEA